MEILEEIFSNFSFFHDKNEYENVKVSSHALENMTLFEALLSRDLFFF